MNKFFPRFLAFLLFFVAVFPAIAGSSGGSSGGSVDLSSVSSDITFTTTKGVKFPAGAGITSDGLGAITVTGNMTTGYLAPTRIVNTGAITSYNTNAASVALFVQGAASQSANLLELRSGDTGSLVASCTNSGAMTATSLDLTGGQLAVADGGTGLSALGSANQLLRVNAGGTALEYFSPTYLTSAVQSLSTYSSSTYGDSGILISGSTGAVTVNTRSGCVLAPNSSSTSYSLPVSSIGTMCAINNSSGLNVTVTLPAGNSNWAGKWTYLYPYRSTTVVTVVPNSGAGDKMYDGTGSGAGPQGTAGVTASWGQVVAVCWDGNGWIVRKTI